MQPPPKPISEILYQLIAKNLILIGYVCLVLVCAILASTFSKPSDNVTTMQRVAGTLLGVILVSAILGYIWTEHEINPWLMAFLSSFCGIGAYKVSHWTMDLWQRSEGYVEFFGKLGRIISAIKKVVNEQNSAQP